MEGMRFAAFLVGGLPLLAGSEFLFEPNTGQTAPGVMFMARGPSSAVYFTAGETVFASRSESIRMRFAGSDPAALFTGEDPAPSVSLYFLGNDPTRWGAPVRHHRRLWRRSLYPGIDAVYYSGTGGIEYDLHVAQVPIRASSRSSMTPRSRNSPTGISRSARATRNWFSTRQDPISKRTGREFPCHRRLSSGEIASASRSGAMTGRSRS